MSTHPSETCPPPVYTIRTACKDDVPHLAEIERSAGQLFRTVGLDSVADDDPMPPEVLSSYLDAGNLWVAETGDSGSGSGGDGIVVAFLAAFPISSSNTDETISGSVTGRGRQGVTTFLHIAELSVHTDHQRRGLASRLLRHLEDAARSTPATPDGAAAAAAAALSLTTYRDLPFNAPFYAKWGFEEISPHDIGGIIGVRGKELWDEEQAKSTAPGRRCWMVKWLDAA